MNSFLVYVFIISYLFMNFYNYLRIEEKKNGRKFYVDNSNILNKYKFKI